MGKYPERGQPMLSINTNLSSIIAQNSLNKSTNALNQAIERMTTGFKKVGCVVTHRLNILPPQWVRLGGGKVICHPELDSGSQEQTNVTNIFPGWGRCHVVTDGVFLKNVLPLTHFSKLITFVKKNFPLPQGARGRLGWGSIPKGGNPC